ncbi:MAG: 3-oxoacyl-ACP reductase [Nevskiaceae bacterium]|nr:MAG: 3-oxoacyl-ACP reductase [Nevskiaceae bacterium]TAM29835.1 MAG: 3-oxoacyl-ACP reductase [Nevskiaceae bacterium]
MQDRYLDFINSPFGKSVASSLGLPMPVRLKRATEGYAARPLAGVTALLAADAEATATGHVLTALVELGATVQIAPAHPGLTPLKAAAQKAGVALKSEGGDSEPVAPVIVFDATGVAGAASLKQVYELFQPRLRRLPKHSRVVVLARAPADTGSVEGATASMALTGFVRSLAKEVGKNGSTANLLVLGKQGDAWVKGALAFFTGVNSAYVTGQVLAVDGAPKGVKAIASPEASLAGKVAVVTGAARGIGAAIAQVLAREGATVVGMDRPAEEGALGATLAPLNGVGLALDVTDPKAPERLAGELMSRFGGADIVVHNAGVTRDKMLRNMAPHLWDMVLDINLGAILRINDRLLQGALKDQARLVCISSIGGIGGNAGQTNYAATKAGVIGYAEALSMVLAKQGMAINAVAPGFIETQMTAAMPAANREVGRRINSLAQGGLPQDIAEAVTFLASPLAAGVNGQTLRVCGQNWLGA